MKFLNFDSVLVLAPHPDDTEASMAATILRCKDTRFTSVVFSTGSVNDPISNEDRWSECAQFWRDTPRVNQLFIAPTLDHYSEEGWINILENGGDIANYQCICLPPSLDTHYEHRMVNGIGMALTRSVPISVLEYRSISAMDTWVPNMFVPIGEYAEEKVKRLKLFKSQDKMYFQPEYMQAFHSHVHSIRRRISAVEQFRVVTLYPV